MSNELYSFHNEFIGKSLAVDQLYLNVAIIFIPWLTHLFIALSGFNIARQKPQARKKSLGLKVRYYLLFFFLFLAEQFVVAPNFGHGLALYPITVWFIILPIIYTIYSLGGVKGTLLAYLGILAIQFLNSLDIINMYFVRDMLALIHPWALNSSDPMSYLGNGLFGILIGHIIFHSHYFSMWRYKIALFLSIASIGFLVGCIKLFQLDPTLVVRHDELLHNDSIGIFFLYAIVGFVLIMISYSSSNKSPKIFEIFKWVSLNSLGIFLFHRIFFVHLLAPIRLHVYSYFQIPMSNSSLELLLFYLPITLLTYAFLKKMNFFGKIFT